MYRAPNVPSFSQTSWGFFFRRPPLAQSVSVPSAKHTRPQLDYRRFAESGPGTSLRKTAGNSAQLQPNTPNGCWSGDVTTCMEVLPAEAYYSPRQPTACCGRTVSTRTRSSASLCSPGARQDVAPVGAGASGRWRTQSTMPMRFCPVPSSATRRHLHPQRGLQRHRLLHDRHTARTALLRGCGEVYGTSWFSARFRTTDSTPLCPLKRALHRASQEAHARHLRAQFPATTMTRDGASLI
jgi:hypothetical protein